MLLGLMGVQDEGLEGGERAERALELRRLALVLQVVAPHLVELAAHGASVAEDLIAHVHLPVSWKQRDHVSWLGRAREGRAREPRKKDSTNNSVGRESRCVK